MTFNKTSLEVVIETEQKEWLEEMVTEYSLPDISKAFRALLDYAIEADSAKEIFYDVRCRFCN